MNGIDLVSIQEEIETHIATAFPNFAIKEDQVLDDEAILRVSNKTKPFVVLRWGGLNRSEQNTSFAGVRHDEYFSKFDIISVAPNPKIARQVLNYFLDGLIGWKITNGASLTPELGESVFPILDSNAVPHLYLGIGTLSFRFNSDNPNSNITP